MLSRVCLTREALKRKVQWIETWNEVDTSIKLSELTDTWEKPDHYVNAMNLHGELRCPTAAI